MKIQPVKRKRIALGYRIAERRAELAVKHHVNTRGEPMDFETYPYLEALYGDPSEQIILQTGAQSGEPSGRGGSTQPSLGRFRR